MRNLLAISALGLAAAPVMAAPLVDGTRDVQYGPALAVQTVETGFGDNFSELNAAYGVIDSGRLYLMLTGNLEANFNKLEIFIDSKAGGQSVFDSSGNDGAQNMDGLRFDAGFTADYHLIARRGNSGGPVFDLDFANLGAQSASGYLDFLIGGGDQGIGSTGTGVNASPIDVGFNNSNLLGVGGGNGAAANQAAAEAVLTGLELSIALSDLGYTGGPINVMVAVNNQNHNFFSNQILAGLPVGTSNLGGNGTGGFTGTAPIDFTTFAGNQYFTVAVPEPSVLALGGVALAAMLRRKRI